MPVIEIGHFPASKSYQADHASAKGLFDLLSEAEGFISASYGFLHKPDPQISVFFIVWETYEHHQKLMNAPHYDQVKQVHQPLCAGALTLQHVPVKVDPTEALNAPFTEVVFLKPKEGKKEEGIAFLRELRSPTSDVSSAEGIRPPLVGGEIMEAPGEYVALLGWESIEAFAAARESDRLKPSWERLEALFESTTETVALVPHKR